MVSRFSEMMMSLHPIAFADEKFNFKIITDPSDLMKFVKKLKEGGKKVRWCLEVQQCCSHTLEMKFISGSFK